MQKLTVPQGEAVCDLLEQCRVVQCAYEQKQAFEQFGRNALEGDRLKAVETEVGESYKDAVTELTDYYVECNNLRIDDDVLVGVLVRNLPSEIALVLNLGPEGAAAA